MKITGQEFDAEERTYATWPSYASSICVADRRMVYAGSCDALSRGEHRGIGVFRLVSQGKRAAPHVLDGRATDLFVESDGPDQKPVIKKDPNREWKISGDMVGDAEAIARAKEIILAPGDSSPNPPLHMASTPSRR